MRPYLISTLTYLKLSYPCHWEKGKKETWRYMTGYLRYFLCDFFCCAWFHCYTILPASRVEKHRPLWFPVKIGNHQVVTILYLLDRIECPTSLLLEPWMEHICTNSSSQQSHLPHCPGDFTKAALPLVAPPYSAVRQLDLCISCEERIFISLVIDKASKQSSKPASKANQNPKRKAKRARLMSEVWFRLIPSFPLPPHRKASDFILSHKVESRPSLESMLPSLHVTSAYELPTAQPL